VTFPLELLWILGEEGQKSAHVEHHVQLPKVGEHGMRARRVGCQKYLLIIIINNNNNNNNNNNECKYMNNVLLY
jgi:hypothetical protein